MSHVAYERIVWLSWEHVRKLPSNSNLATLTWVITFSYLRPEQTTVWMVSFCGNKPQALETECTHKEAKDQRREVAADEALPGLLRGELQERRDTGCL